ncbi:MAG: hypothetical protein ACREBN_12170 [Burkholderiaceae bacterium]
MGARPAARLFAELINALHDESDALVCEDAARLAQAASRKDHLLRLLAPQANALRSMRRSGSDELERFAREAAQLTALESDCVQDGLVSSRTSVARTLWTTQVVGDAD